MDVVDGDDLLFDELPEWPESVVCIAYVQVDAEIWWQSTQDIFSLDEGVIF